MYMQHKPLMNQTQNVNGLTINPNNINSYRDPNMQQMHDYLIPNIGSIPHTVTNAQSVNMTGLIPQQPKRQGTNQMIKFNMQQFPPVEGQSGFNTTKNKSSVVHQRTNHTRTNNMELSNSIDDHRGLVPSTSSKQSVGVTSTSQNSLQKKYIVSNAQ